MAIQQQPRMFGDWGKDGPAMAEWLKGLISQLQSLLETTNKLSGTAGDINPNDLPDPATSNVATSQKTANDAYLAALAARSLAGNLVYAGSVTISGTATSADATFATAQADTSYFVSATLAGTTGAPASGSTSVSGLTKTTAMVTVSVGVAPGAGNSVSFDVLVTRNPGA